MPYRFRDFELDPLRYQLTRQGEPVDIPRRIFELILLLLRHRDRPVTKEEILATVWHGRAVTDASLTHAVATARRALGDSPKSQDTIKTVHTRGYWWVAETVESFDEPADTRGRPFVGRRDELRTIAGALDQARAGRRTLVFVVGEAGVGKTSLVQVATALMSRDGSLVVSACAADLNPAPPLYLWRQVLSKLAAAKLTDDSTMSLMGSQFAEGAGEVADSSSRNADLFLESVAAKLRLFESLGSLLRSAAAEARLVLVLEDLHTADLASLEALNFLMSQPERLPVLFIGTHRPIIQGEGAEPSTLARLTRAHEVRSILLQNFSRQEVREFLEVLSDDAVPSSGFDGVFAASGGNPFLLWQLVALARARNGLASVTSGDPIPSTMRAAIAAHTDDLPARSRELLRLGSVAGQTFDLLVLAEVAGESAAAASSLIKPCIDAGIIRARSSHRFEFAHMLLRDSLYDGVDPHERAILHLSIGEAMGRIFGTSSGDHLPSMAFHLSEAASIGGRSQAIAAYRRCGELAIRNLAFQDGASLFGAALSLAENETDATDELRCELMLQTASARLCAGDRPGARQMLASLADRAERTGHGHLLAQAALNFAPSVLSLEVGVVDDLLIATLERALDVSLIASPETSVDLAGRLALALYWAEDSPRRAAATRRLQSCTTGRTAAEHARSTLYHLGSTWSPDDLDDRRALLEELNEKRSDLPDSLAPVVRVYRFTTFLELNAIDAMEREISLLEQEIRESRAPYCAWYPKMFRSCFALLRGEHDAALRLIQDYTAIGQRFEDSNVINSLAAQLAEVYWLRGNVAFAMEHIEKMVERFPRIVEWQCVVVLFLVLLGRLDEARARLNDVQLGGFSLLNRRRSTSSVISACLLAESVSRLEMTECAPDLFRFLLPYRGRNAVAGYGVVSWGSVSRFLGQMAFLSGRTPEAIELLEEALASDSAARSDSWRTRSEIALARALRSDAPRSERAALLASQAHERATRLGMTLLRDDARRLT
jgi:DNA-binding winged helix-turn-helix (wHTH) protein/tetratricopeptide (TPR) repeat protein